MKTILKEIGIGALILIVILLILGITFYDYSTNDKIIPTKIEAYTMEEQIAEEVKKAQIKEQEIIKTYKIDSTDLSAYESTDNYDKGKSDPFAQSERVDTNTNVNTSTSENTSANTNSQGYFNTTGK